MKLEYWLNMLEMLYAIVIVVDGCFTVRNKGGKAFVLGYNGSIKYMFFGDGGPGSVLVGLLIVVLVYGVFCLDLIYDFGLFSTRIAQNLEKSFGCVSTIMILAVASKEWGIEKKTGVIAIIKWLLTMCAVGVAVYMFR